MSPNFAKGYIDRGIVYHKQKMYDEAIADFSKAIELAPENTTTYYNRSASYRAKGMTDKSIEDFTKANNLNREITETAEISD
ncbi:MAG: tetratricopeptide repeat protein [Acidaminococcales bacterium]|nr:tetratricopeptide repeat protein [Acidaminococcales bacterium]